MDRIVEVLVNGNHVTKDSQYAGTQGEANVTFLRIEFDDGWDGFTKTITWWDAKGETPTSRILTAAELEDIKASTRIYLTPVVPEALAIWGQCMFAIDGYTNGKRQRSAYAHMVVKPLGNGEDVTIEDVTPTVAEQLQSQIETLLEQIQGLGQGEVSGVPAGGSTGQFLMKASDEDHETVWASLNIEGDQLVVDLSGMVRYDGEQTLTAAQQAQARANIGAVSEAFVAAAINTALGDYPTALAGLDEAIGGEGV